MGVGVGWAWSEIIIEHLVSMFKEERHFSFKLVFFPLQCDRALYEYSFLKKKKMELMGGWRDS